MKSTEDPFFTYVVHEREQYAFKGVPIISNADWFDSECQNAKQCYLEALSVFNRCKSDTSSTYLCDCKRRYKSLIRQKKKQFKYKKVEELENLKYSKPISFWKHFRKTKSQISNKLNIDDFFNYFSTLEHDI